MLWEKLREEEFENAIERSGGVCIIPMGCLEKHGQHLPVGTDHLETESIIEAALKKEEAVNADSSFLYYNPLIMFK